MCQLIYTCAVDVSYLLNREISTNCAYKKITSTTFDYCWTRLMRVQWTRTHQRPISIVAIIKFITHERWCDLSYSVFFYLSVSLSLFFTIRFFAVVFFFALVIAPLWMIYTERKKNIDKRNAVKKKCEWDEVNMLPFIWNLKQAKTYTIETH